MSLPNYFSGKGTAVVAPSGEGLLKSQENLSSILVGIEKMKADTYKENSKEFQKASNIDPVFVLGDSAQKTQMGAINLFNQKWGKVFQQTGGNLSDAQKMQMNTDKNVVIMQQQRMQSQMEAAQTQNKMVAQNPNRWDRDEQARRYNEYIQTGNYNYTEPPIKPLSLTDAAMKNVNKVAVKEYHLPEEDKAYSKNGVNWIDKTTYSAGKEDVIPYIKNAMTDDQYAAGVIKEWSELGQADKDKYHAKNPANPIFEMAVDRHWKEWVKQDVKTERNMVSGSGKGYSFDFGGQKVTASPGVKRKDPVPYGDQVYTDSYRFDKPIPIGNVPTEGGIKYTRNSTRPLGKGNVQGVIKDYIADGDLVTIEVKKAYGAANVESGEFISVPASSIPDVDNLPIIGDDGNPTKVGNVRGKTQPSVKKKLY